MKLLSFRRVYMFSLFKWYLYRKFGIKSSNTHGDVNPAEEYLQTNREWPIKIRGSIYLLDCGSEENDFAHWAIATFEIEGMDGAILVEFKGDLLQKENVNIEFKFNNLVSLWVNPAVNEYYQVTDFKNS